MNLEESHSDRFMETFGTGQTKKDEHEKLELARQELIVDYNRKVLEKTLEDNATRPVRVQQVNVIGGAHKYRDAFLARQLQPLLCENGGLTLEKFLKNVDLSTLNLTKTGAIDNIGMSFHLLPNRGSYSWPNALDLVTNVQLKPVNKFFMKVGTNIGNGEGDGYLTMQWRNIFGGAECLNLDTNLTSNNIKARSKSQYLLSYTSPILNHPDFKYEGLIYHSSRLADYTTYHEQLINGITNRFSTNYLTVENQFNHQISFENLLRSIKLAHAPGNYRNISLINDYHLYNAGDALKSSIVYTISHDSRDQMIIPRAGHFFKSSLELSMLPGSRFVKGQTELSTAKALSETATLNACFKTGLLKALQGDGVHPMDKFQLGGANDVRGFLMSGLGPKQMGLTIGGDASWVLEWWQFG
ncbi:unnamed protein product [Ambrosiozyma monospora]|uniref:Unnamed protein product n=1 Tax=Ambrosiozyma monospora TaxID=43982 RepID=A0ACB5SZQ6_AMBMO|nr:unnamed protein product [Ambrosiozyma monospora]